jgi:hypothetical protein
VGRRSLSSGVRAIGHRTIQFDFKFEGVRYRPTLLRVPSESNLRRAREQLRAIKISIAERTFSFIDEFPDFRDLQKVPSVIGSHSCARLFDDFLAHCESRHAKNDLASVTLASYRRVLNGVWRPKIGAELVHRIRYSMCRRSIEPGAENDQKVKRAPIVGAMLLL